MLSPVNVRKGVMRLLLEIDWNGKTWRFADEALDAPFGPLGATVRYYGGLDVGGGYTRAISFYSTSRPSRGTTATVPFAELLDSTAAEVQRGTPLNSEVRLYAHPHTSGVRDLLLRGVVGSFDYGRDDEPVTLSIVHVLDEDTGTIQDSEARVNGDNLGTTWDWDAETEGQFYPVVIGKPGLGAIAGSPAFGITTVAAPTEYVIVAGHRVAASTVGVRNKTQGYSDAAAAVTTTVDDSGQTISIADVSGQATPWEEGDEIWAAWNAGDGGLTDGDGSLIRGAGDVLVYFARLSSVRFDMGALRAVAPLLNSIQIDSMIQAAPGKPIRPWEWVRSHVLPLLPVDVVDGELGLSLAVWQPDASEDDAVLRLVEGENCAMVGAVESSSLRSVVNDVSVEYRIERTKNRPTKTLTVSSAGALDTFGATRIPHPVAIKSHGLFGPRSGSTVRAEAVFEQDSAAQVAIGRIRHYGLSRESVEVQPDHDLTGYQPGVVVTYTNADLGWTERVGTLMSAGVSSTGFGRFGLTFWDEA